ncbi:hypothetical protein DE146DRAFT_722051 [Phaeosphaeria sp. MPI-PUGE-AT-0046c]|nr:hypothetical protein DE146DRAFT_722051 [Phaeosphaeria sp. MPI-PUGE-AT-0046c]
MPRPPIACRGAVQTLQPSPSQHIWISDQLLSHTLHRFLRTTCPHQKRHGSHVPGPLEARRRASKRRMTVSANFYPQDSLPSSFDLSALFGFRSKAKPSWTYEPPTPRADPEPLPTWTPEHTTEKASSSLVSSVSASPHVVSSLAPGIEHTLNAQQEWREHGARDIAVLEATSLSAEAYESLFFTGYKPAFEAFQRRAAKVHELGQQEQDDILREAYQECCPTSEVWMYTTRVFRHMLHLGLNPQAVLSHQAKSEYAVPPIHTEESSDILDCLEKFMHQYPHCVSDIHRIHIQLAKTAALVSPSNVYQETRLLKLVKHMWLSAHLQGIGRSTSTLDLLHSIANNCNNQTRRTTLTTIFSAVTPLETALFNLVLELKDELGLMAPAMDIVSCIPHEVLLQSVRKLTNDIAKGAIRGVGKSRFERLKGLHVWLQLLHQLDDKNTQTERKLVDTAFTTVAEYVFSSPDLHKQSPLLFSTCLIIASQKAAYRDIPFSKISATLKACYAVLEQNGSPSFEVTSGVVMSKMLAKRLPHKVVVQMIADTLVRHAKLGAIRDFLNVLDRRSLALVDPTSVYSRISHQVAIMQKNTNVSSNDDAILYTYQQVLRPLSQISTIPGGLEVKLERLIAERQFKNILQGAEALSLLPPEYCNYQADMPLDERVFLIHQIAHQYTTHPELSQKVASRAIYRLYQYLQQQSLPIGPLFSKAVVRVSIIRPMLENRFVSARRLIWVCHLVTKVEGEDVAKKIEANFWHWRGDLIQHAKGVHNSIGGHRQEKAHVGTMKKLGLI